MSNSSSHHDSNQKNTSSGQGALGMGGQPDDDPRDQAGGDARMIDDDLTGDQPVAGAFGNAAGAQADAASTASQTVGPVGDSGAMADVEAALRKATAPNPS